ncbi:hypothetical protein D9M69_730370 [compost metagenome]
MLQRLVLGLHQTEHFRALDVEPGGTGKMDLEAAVDADDADILAGGFGTISRTAGHGKLDLGRGP